MATAPTSFRPRAVVHIEIDQPLKAVQPLTSAGEPYQAAMLLVLVHGRPIGTVDVDLPNEGLGAAAVAEAIWNGLSNEIVAHFEADELDVPTSIPTDGLVSGEHAACWRGEPTGAAAPMVSIVIATKDRTEELQACITTLLDLDYPSFEIVVVDNGPSTKSTREMVETKFGHDSRVVYVFDPAAGTSNARNMGVAAAKGDIVAFTDDDVIINRNWLRALVRQFALHPDVDCVTGLVFPAAFDTQAQQWFEEYGGFNKGYAAQLFERKPHEGANLLHPYTAGKFGSGNNCAFRKEALQRLGGFDLALGPGSKTPSGEDLDLFLAVIMSGAKIAYEPAAVVGHFHRADYEGLKKQLRNYGIGLTALFTKWSLRSPIYAFDIARRVPMGLWFALSPKSSKNEKRSADYPPELVREELRGMLSGPWSYIRSRLQTRKSR